MDNKQEGVQVFVAKLSPSVREDDLRDEFSKHGKIDSVMLKRNYCFIEYSTKEEAEKAIEALNKTDFMGSELIVELASEALIRWR